MRAVSTLADIPEDAWCILRCTGRTTLRLAESLAADGFEVWTPKETRKIRIPRMNVRREVVLALLPSYVFAKARHLIDLLQLANMDVKPRRGHAPAHASFTVMHYHDRIPLVADKDLAGLRTLEIKLTPKPKAERAFATGAKVKVEGGSFGGMMGDVRRSDRTHTLVCFNDKYVVKILTSLLLPDELNSLLSREDTAARRAA